MSMPIDLVLVRHGRSEGNEAKTLSRGGDTSVFTPEYLARHSSKFRLTDRGREQAVTAGEWLRAAFERFDRFYVSEYIRAVETAGLLDLPHADWRKDFYLREMDYGQLDVLSEDEQQRRFSEALAQRNRDGFYWTPPGSSESMATLCLRFDRLLGTLHRECSDKKVIVVCHGLVMWAARIRLERMSSERYATLDASEDDHDRIHNCQIIQYTRKNPETGELTRHLNWMRSVCPWDSSLSSNTWVKIERPRYTNADLLAEAARHPRLVNSGTKP